MHDIDRVLRGGGRRLWIDGFLRALVGLGTVGAVVVLGLVAAHKLTAWTPEWGPVLVVIGGVVFVAALGVSWARRARGLALADELDRRAGLRETLSTAVALSGRGDAWSAAVRESAEARARRVVLRDAAPIRTPRGWGVPVAVLACAGLVLWLSPRHDLTGLLVRERAEATREAEVRQAALEIRARESELNELLDRAGVSPRGEDEGDETGRGEAKSPEDLNRAALRRLTKLSDDLREMQRGEKAQRLEALQEGMRKLRSPGPGGMDEFARALSRGRFEEAKAALEEMGRALENGSMSDAEREAAGEQLGKLGEQLERIAAEREALRERLERAGMDPGEAARLAGDPAALESALEKLEGLSEEARKALMDAALAQRSAGESMGAMGALMQQLGEAMQSNPGQCSSPMQGLGERLSMAEMLASEMRALDAAMRACEAQMASCGQSLCEGGLNPGEGLGAMGQLMASGNQGRGTGSGIGAGAGGSRQNPDLAPADDYVLKSERTRVANRGGAVIGSTLVYGSQVRGEAEARFGEVVGASSVEAAEAIETMRVPREYHDAVRHYFGRLEAIAKRGEKKE
jgi:hypothetical protein